MHIAFADFGLAHVYSFTVGLMRTNCRTSHYTVPEVYKKEPYRPSCDMWTFRATVFATVVGTFPFEKSGGRSLMAV